MLECPDQRVGVRRFDSARASEVEVERGVHGCEGLLELGHRGRADIVVAVLDIGAVMCHPGHLG